MAEPVQLPSRVRHLYRHLLENRYIVPIVGADPACRGIDSDQSCGISRRATPAGSVRSPPAVAEEIKQKRLFGWTPR